MTYVGFFVFYRYFFAHEITSGECTNRVAKLASSGGSSVSEKANHPT